LGKVGEKKKFSASQNPTVPSLFYVFHPLSYIFRLWDLMDPILLVIRSKTSSRTSKNSKWISQKLKITVRRSGWNRPSDFDQHKILAVRRKSFWRSGSALRGLRSEADHLRSADSGSSIRFHCFACNFLVRCSFWLKFVSFFFIFRGLPSNPEN
jgi:hypothetical protein